MRADERPARAARLLGEALRRRLDGCLLVLVASVIAFGLYYWAMSRTEASRVAIWANMQPVAAALLACAIYGERLTGSFVASAAMVIAGVVLTERG